MAEWKALGYVPDSDDDEDSQSSEATDVLAISNVRHEVHREHHDGLGDMVIRETGAGDDELQDGGRDNAPQEQDDQDDPAIDSPINHEIEFASSHDSHIEKEDVDQNNDLDELGQDHYGSPPDRPHVVQILEGSPRQTVSGPAVASSPRVSIRSSKPSSALSSIPSSPNAIASAAYHSPSTASGTNVFSRQVLDSAATAQSPDSGQSVDVVVEQQRVLDTIGNARVGRSFRQRNPIQLHPYALEGEQYRQSLKARGIKPLHILHVQNELVETRADESQLFGMDDERGTQSSNEILASSSPASSPLRTVSKRIRSSDGMLNGSLQPEEDELPDLASLLRSRPTPYASMGNKRRKPDHTFSKKHRPPSSAPVSLMAKGVGSSAQANEDVSMYDVPASPPSSRHTRQSSPESFAPSTHGPQRIVPAGLPTPLTSSEPRRRPQLQLSDSEESDSPMNLALETDHVSLVSSEDDGQPQVEPVKDLERVQRRIRGVLPASWLRLDQKMQVSNTNKPYRAIQDHTTDAPTALRGVATVVSRSKTSNSIPSMDFQTIESDTEDPAEQSEGSDTLPELDLGGHQVHAAESRRSRASEEYGPERWGEVEEDNSVDAMLPSSKGHLKSSSRRLKSGRKSNPSAAVSAVEPVPMKTRKRRHYQPKISSQLVRKPSKAPKFVMPRLGILDVLDPPAEVRSAMPQFVRIACRTARSRKDKGRHHPVGKVLQLANDQETGEIFTTLRHWREGKIQPRKAMKNSTQRRPLEPTSGNGNPSKPLPSTVPHVGTANKKSISTISKTTQPRNQKTQGTLDIIIQREPQRRIEPPPRKYKYTQKASSLKEPPMRGHVSSALRNDMGARPALLETLLTEHEHSRPEAAFGRKLVQVNRLSKHSKTSGRSRSPFISEDADPQVESGDIQKPSSVEPGMQRVALVQQRSRTLLRKKRPPRRLAVGSEPDQRLRQSHIEKVCSVTSDGLISNQENQRDIFHGLERFGGHYSATFKVTPLPTGTSFPKDTFVGSGDFYRYTAWSSSRDLEERSGPLTVQLPTGNTIWSQWNDAVSTEMGHLFDEILAFVKNLSSAESPAQTRCARILSTQKSIINYVANHLSFIDAIDRTAFLRRCTSLVDSIYQELASLEAPASQAVTIDETSTIATLDLKLRIGTMNLCIADQLDKISNNDLVPVDVQSKANMSRTSHIHYLLTIMLRDRKAAFRQCLHDLRPLEGCEHSIQVDHAPLEAFVVCHNMMTTDSSSSAAFWQIFNNVHGTHVAKNTADLRSVEKLWHSLFTLLPFLEINSKGVLEVGRRFNIQCDNWPPIRNAITQVLQAYTANRVGHFPTLNAYFRTLFSRCFHLINDWNWVRCESIVGTLFDFFARHNLAHLKHEECHGSPAFLERLADNPGLSIGSNDRCFHILLKVMARGLQKMRLQYPAKKIRDIVWRLMPNHGRSHPKEQALHRDDLDALRNHHDLLCTLYWASPPEFRPRLTVLRNLVDLETSHREACHLNIHAWSNLVQYQLSVQEPLSSLRPFADWHDDLLAQILRQHAQARSEAEEQARLIEHNGGLGVSKDLLETTIARNQRQVEGVLGDALVRLQLAIAAARNAESAKVLFTSAISSVFSLLDARQPQGNTVIIQALDVLLAYLKNASPLPGSSRHVNDDSQDYGDWSAFAEDDTHSSSETIAATHFRDIGETPLRHLLSNCFGADNPPKDDLLVKVIDVWGLAALMFVKCGMKSWNDYIGPWGQDSWCSLQQTQHTRRFRNYFLARLIEVNEDIYFENSQYFLRAWMESLVERESLFKFQHRLTSAVLNVDSANSLLANLPFWANKGTGRFEITATDLSLRRLSVVSSVLSNMRESLENAEHEDRKVTRTMKQEYGELLKHLMNAMKHKYQELGPTSNLRGAYVDFAHRVVEFLQQHTASICPVDRFFTDSSEFPLPIHDPFYVVGQLKHYGLRLQDPKTHKQLASFLQSVSQRAAIEGHQQYLTDQLYAAMTGEVESGEESKPTLRAFLVKNILPAYLQVGFTTSVGWVLLLPFSQALQKVFYETLDVLDGSAVASLAAVASMMDCFLGSLRGTVSQQIGEDPNVLCKPEFLRVLGECFETMAGLLPALDYLIRLGGFVGSSIDCAEYFRSFVSTASEEDTPYHGINDDLNYNNDSAPRCAAVQVFALRELKESLSKCWTSHNGCIYVTHGNTRKEVITKMGSYEEEMESYRRATRKFVDVLQALPAFLSPDEEHQSCETRKAVSFGDLVV